MNTVSVTDAQMKIIFEAMDMVVKHHGLSCLQAVLPVITALQEAVATKTRPDLEVAEKE